MNAERDKREMSASIDKMLGEDGARSLTVDTLPIIETVSISGRVLVMLLAVVLDMLEEVHGYTRDEALQRADVEIALKRGAS